VAVDAMGGDHAPASIVAGAVDAARTFPDQVVPVLVGDEPRLRRELSGLGAESLGLEIVHAEEHVEMAEKGAGAFRKKRQSSMSVAARMVREGRVQGVFSAGNTGAAVASSLLDIGRIKGVSRPALATLIPSSGPSTWAILLDVGATADTKPIHLYQFALLGEVYARILLKTQNPRVGLLNIGEEPGKGTDLVQEAYSLLLRRANFVGNVEGKDILQGVADVVVTDGFTGNVLLKFAESVWTFAGDYVRSELGSHLLAKTGVLFLRPSLRRLKARVDYSEYGGAPLLGVDGVSIIGHGRSNPKAVRNAIRFAGTLIRSGLNDQIRAEFEREQGGEVVNS
jgi:glycerol-3-phosphate acyltransferase PlsX